MSFWKVIPGYPKYIISLYGIIWSITTRVKSKHGTRLQKGRILKPYDRKGYPAVRLYNNSGSKAFCIHRLVVMCFNSSYNETLQVNHIDGNKLNNHNTNLEMCTALHNVRHAERLGLAKHPKGNNHYKRKQMLNLKNNKI